VSLAWSANPEADVQGYEVHRSTSYGGPYAKAHTGVIAGTSWADSTVSVGSIYYYRLRAVDVCGNLSAFSAPSGAMIISDGDFDDDGYSDDLERSVGTNPLDGSSGPVATVLSLSPVQALVGVGGSVKLTVAGIFDSASGGTVEYDMSCVVDYRSDPSGVVAVDGCGNAVGRLEGTTEVWAWQVVGGQTVAASNPAMVRVAGAAPYVDERETRPYDGQGMNEDTNRNGTLDAGEDLDGDGALDVDSGPTPRVPADTGIVVRVVDDTGIDAESVRMLVNGADVPVKVREIEAGDMRVVDIAWRNLGAFAFDDVVVVELSLTDVGGTALYHAQSFQVESEAEHQWALAHTPPRAVSDLGGGLCEVSVVPVPDSINDELLDGAKLVYRCDEPVEPRFGPVGELPPVDIAAPVGMPLNLEPANVFDVPVTLIVPLPGVTLEDANHDGIPDGGLDGFDIKQYTAEPSTLWRDGSEVAGWEVAGSRVNRYETVPPTIELRVNHFSGAQAGGQGCVEPSARISVEPSQVEVGEVARFTDTSAGVVSSRLWDFGDGATSTEPNPAHAYQAPGVYTVTLTVTGPCGIDSYTTGIGVCAPIHLLAPPDGAIFPTTPTLCWGPSCNTDFVIEFSFDPDFTSIFAQTPPITGHLFPVPLTFWERVPKYRTIYWRVKGENRNISPRGTHTSEETWSLQRS
jgi:hypothetical protein